MLALETVLGVFVMGKNNIPPLFGRMTFTALFAITSVVYIIDAMTGDAIFWCVLVTLVRMTAFAACAPVFAF